MLHSFFSGINPPKYHKRKTGAEFAPRFKTTLCRENLSLTGCSSAEPVSVSVQRVQKSNLITIFTTCRKTQPFTVQLRIKLIVSIVILSTISAIGQTFKIPEGKYELYWNKFFIDKCRKATSELPFKVDASINSCTVSMKYSNLFSHVAVPFILDGDTALLSYTKIELEEYGNVINKHHTWFDFEAVGFFEYNGFWVIVYSYPLEDPNTYKCYTINTYSKDGKRIDRLPLFKWECNRLSVVDITWFEITGYIDEKFEITVQTRCSWNDVNSGIYEGDALEEKKKQKYSVYQINDNGMFELINKETKYVVDDKNNWTHIN